MADQDVIEKVRRVKNAHEQELMQKPNVVGVGIGFRHRGGQRTDDVVLVVMVENKVAASALGPNDLVPAEIEGVPVDVQEVGRITPE